MTVVGDIVWVYDQNRRDGEGRWGAYVQRQIIGETRVSWILGYPGSSALDSRSAVKVKKNEWPGTYLLSEDDVKRQQWISNNRYRITETVQHYSGPDVYDVLRKVAELTGYQEKP